MSVRRRQRFCTILCLCFASLITLIYTGPRSNDRLQKYFFHKSDKRDAVSECACLAQKWSKIAPQEKVGLWVFVNHPAVHSGGVSRGPMAVAVGFSDM